MKTVLETGPGAWELRAAKKARPRRAKTKSVSQALPTRTHMAFVAMQKAGFLHTLVSQNTDGLHRKSGMPAHSLLELHGNTNMEKCRRCGKAYLRDFRTRGWDTRGKGVHYHKTGRACSCGGNLRDTIINFGESLPDDIDKAFDRAQTVGTGPGSAVKWVARTRAHAAAAGRRVPRDGLQPHRHAGGARLAGRGRL